MFGYVRAFKPELKMKEFELYRGVYCSICGSLLRRYGPAAQLALSYDGAFFALTMLAAGEASPPLTRGRCCYNPLKTCARCRAGAIDFCADLSVLLMGQKLRDHVADSRGLKKLFFGLLRLLFLPLEKKAARRQPKAAQIAACVTVAQTQAEQDPGLCLDAAAHPAAQGLGELLALALGERYFRFGYLTGRWVYLMDAADDLADDLRRGRFNPLRTYREKNQAEASEKMSEILQATATELLREFDALPLRASVERAVLNNILVCGLAAAEREILVKKGAAH